MLSNLTEGHLFLADGAVMREVFECGREVSARLHRFQHVGRAETAALQAHDASDHPGFLAPNALRDWYLAVEAAKLGEKSGGKCLSESALLTGEP